MSAENNKKESCSFHMCSGVYTVYTASFLTKHTTNISIVLTFYSSDTICLTKENNREYHMIYKEKRCFLKLEHQSLNENNLWFVHTIYMYRFVKHSSDLICKL